MRSQQEAEKAEQQRIKNLVLNYDLNDDPTDGELPAFHYVQSSNKTTRLVGTGSLNRGLRVRDALGYGQPQRSTAQSRLSDEENITPPASDDSRNDSFTDETGPYDGIHATTGPRYDKSGNTRQKQRARKLQLGDIDWYGKNHPTPPANPLERKEGEHSLDQYIVDKKSNRGRGSRFKRGGGGRGRGLSSQG